MQNIYIKVPTNSKLSNELLDNTICSIALSRKTMTGTVFLLNGEWDLKNPEIIKIYDILRSSNDEYRLVISRLDKREVLSEGTDNSNLYDVMIWTTCM